MTKKYIENHKLNMAIELLLNCLDYTEEYSIHDVIKLESGDYLPKHQMQKGKFSVYGGGGKTENNHNEFNIDFETIGIGRVGARCGCVFTIEKKSWVTDNALYVKEYDKRFTLKYLKHFLNYSNLNQYANNAMQPVISKTGIQSVKIPLLPFERQVELGEFIDELEKGNFEKANDYPIIKNRIDILDKIENFQIKTRIQKKHISQLRQSILQEAIQGKLTAEWRRQNPNTEPATQMLKRIKAEKEQLIREKKINREKPLSPISDKEIPFELPEKWAWYRLGEIIEMIYGDSLTKKQYIANAPYPVFGSNGIVGYYTKYLTAKKTIIVGRKGSAGAINICNKPSWTTDVAYYIEENDNLNFDFIFYLLKSLRLENFGKGIKPGVNRNDVYNLIIPLPPLSEQQAIVSKLETLMAKCDQLQEEIENQNRHSKELLRALFNETFSGF